MAAREYSTGVVGIYVRFPGDTAASFLGTSEQGPQRQTDRAYKQLQNDLTSQKPLDYIYAGGEEASLSFTLTWWDDFVAQRLEAAPVSGKLGKCNIYDMGTLMGQEGKALEIWYAWAFRGPGMKGAGWSKERGTMLNQEGGRHYVQALFWGPETDEIGTHERKKHMMFRCWKKLIFPGGVPTYVLFDDNFAGVGNLG